MMLEVELPKLLEPEDNKISDVGQMLNIQLPNLDLNCEIWGSLGSKYVSRSSCLE